MAKSLIAVTWKLFQQGLFDDQYDNIARTAPELKKNVIYKTFSHIGSDEGQKNIGEALTRCLYAKEATFHAMAFVPGEDDGNGKRKCIILSKNIASMNMKTDDKTRGEADDGGCKRKEYMVILELEYEVTTHLEDTHDLGIFTNVLRH